MALSANNLSNFIPSGEQASFPMGVDIIYAGAMLMINLDGYAMPASWDGDFILSDGYFLGVAMEYQDNSGGSAGDKEVLVDIGGGIVKTTHVTGSLTIANVGDAVAVASDNTVDVVSTSTDITAGKIAEVLSATSIKVKLYPFGTIS